jgi:hypothetical protein
MKLRLGIVFIFSLVFYLFTITYIRWDHSRWYLPENRRIWDIIPVDIEGKKDIQVQLCALSQKQVAELLIKNPGQSERCQLGMTLNIQNSLPNQEYLVIRYMNTNRHFKWGSFKCYFSNFSYPFTENFYGPPYMYDYYDYIIPFPAEENDAPKRLNVLLTWKELCGT